LGTPIIGKNKSWEKNILGVLHWEKSLGKNDVWEK